VRSSSTRPSAKNVICTTSMATYPFSIIFILDVVREVVI
jgi:hypothetical protein